MEFAVAGDLRKGIERDVVHIILVNKFEHLLEFLVVLHHLVLGTGETFTRLIELKFADCHEHIDEIQIDFDIRDFGILVVIGVDIEHGFFRTQIEIAVGIGREMQRCIEHGHDGHKREIILQDILIALKNDASAGLGWERMQLTGRNDEDFSLIQAEFFAAGLDSKAVFDWHDDFDGMMPMRWIKFRFDIVVEHDKSFIGVFHGFIVIIQMLNHIRSLLFTDLQDQWSYSNI